MRNSPYSSFLLQEIRGLLRRYCVDGLYIEGLYGLDCHCNYCRAEFFALFGRELPTGASAQAEDDEYIEFRSGVATDFVRHVRSLIEHEHGAPPSYRARASGREASPTCGHGVSTPTPWPSSGSGGSTATRCRCLRSVCRCRSCGQRRSAPRSARCGQLGTSIAIMLRAARRTIGSTSARSCYTAARPSCTRRRCSRSSQR